MATIVIAGQTYEDIKEVQLPTEDGFAHFVYAYGSAGDDTELPSGYTRISTAVTSAGSWFLTDVQLTSEDVLQITFKITTPASANNGSNTIFTDNSANGYGLKWYGSAVKTVNGYCGGTNFSGTASIPASSLITVLVYANSAIKNAADNTDILAPVANGGKTSGNYMRIGEGNSNGSMIGELGAFKVIRDGAVYREFLPCTNSSNVVGFYETKTDTFYQSSGTAFA